MLSQTRVKPPVSCIMLARIMTRRCGFWSSSYWARTSAPAGLASAATYFSQNCAFSALPGLGAMPVSSSRVTVAGAPVGIDGVAAAGAGVGIDGVAAGVALATTEGVAASGAALSGAGGGAGGSSFTFGTSHGASES